MSLNYDLSGIKDCEELTDVDSGYGEGAVTKGVIFSMMAVGVQSITEKNYKDVAARIAVSEKVNGVMLHKGGDSVHGPFDRPITLADVKRRIGLTTNVSNVTLSRFLNNLMGQTYQEIRNQLDVEDRAESPVSEQLAHSST